MEYKELEQIALVKGGKRLPKGHQLVDIKTNHPYLRITDYTNGFVDLDQLKYISEETFEIISRYIINSGDVFLSIVGTIGIVDYIDESLDGANLTENAVKIEVKNIEDYSPIYLSYYLKSPAGQHEINSRTVGSTQKKLAIKRIRKILVPDITIEEQHKIAYILNSYDKKIEINNKIIANLEAQAQTLFKYYFVDFEPFSDGNFVDSDLGPIPEGWEVKKLKEKNKRLNGFTYKSADLNYESDYNMVTIKNFNRYGGQPNDVEKPIDISDRIKEHHYLNDGDIVVACTDLTQAADVIGRVIYYYKNDKFNKEIYSMDVVKIVPNIKDENLFLYFSLKSSRFKDYASSTATGTTVLHFPKPGIDKYKMVYPPESVIKKFTKIVEPIIFMQNNLINQNQTLAEIRDALLPKLMAGEIDLENLGGPYD